MLFGLNLFKALFFTAGPKYSWKKATLVITLSMTAVLSLSLLGTLAYVSMRHFQLRGAVSVIQAVVQTGSQSYLQTGLRFAHLPTSYLTEALELSVDCPINLNRFDLDEAKNRLLATHIIGDVRLKKMKPNLLFIDYVLREPWAFLEDYTNTVIDAEGFFFPYTPFYTPRTLPKVYLGEHAPVNPWGDRMTREHCAIVHALCAALQKEEIERIDLSHLTDSSAGRREIILMLKGGVILRLAPKNCIQQLTYYSILKTNFLNRDEEPMIIDLRIPEVAYIQRIRHEG